VAYGILRRWAGVLLGGLRVTLPTQIVSIRVGVAHGVGLLNGEGTIMALNGSMPLHITSLANGVDPNW